MEKPTLYGAVYSVYVRIARMTLFEKGVKYSLVPVDVFAEGGLPDWYSGLHPFGRIPAFEHGDLRIYETGAICRYIDEAFPGPSLQPQNARARAAMLQITSMMDNYAYKPMVWDVAVERLEKSEPDEALIASALARSAAVLAALTRLKQPGIWLLGDYLTLADLHAGAIVSYFCKAPEGRAALSNEPLIDEWFSALGSRESYLASLASTD